MTERKHEPSSRQRDYLRVIDTLRARFDYGPSLREVAEELVVSEPTVFNTVSALERRGLVARTYGVARSLRLTDAGREALRETPAA